MRMKGFAKQLAVGSMALAAFALFTPAKASEWNKKTDLTVNETIEVPGAILPPGHYVVKLLDSQSNRNIVQFFNQSEDKVYSTVLAIPNQRLEPTGKSVFTFYEVPKGEPPALRAWFYPGDTYGQEFVYSRRRGVALSKSTHQNVATIPDEYEETMKHPKTDKPRQEFGAAVVTRTQREKPDSNESKRASAYTTQAPSTLTPASSDRENRMMAQNRPAQTSQPQTYASERLPQTASDAPLIGLIGLLSLAAAGGLFMLSRRV